MVVVVVCAQINENVLTNNFCPAFSGSASSADGPAEGVCPLFHVVDASVTSPLAFVRAESLIILGSRLNDHVLVAGAESLIIFRSRLDDHVLVVDDFGVVVAVLVAVSSSLVITSSIGDVAPLLLLTAQASLSAFSLSCFSVNCLRCCKKRSYSLVKLSNLEMYNSV